ncbi:hypothetical protein CMV_019096 [Castanea mollissima]|uniref:Uncharacterized protein n=1 Tax=Castanea mollissima TaxID=60419 RepID=A0A8J4QQR6_9ROSI|nr:hypothetical protein CMV_019096 [Castanea mollissima]
MHHWSASKITTGSKLIINILKGTAIVKATICQSSLHSFAFVGGLLASPQNQLEILGPSLGKGFLERVVYCPSGHCYDLGICWESQFSPNPQAQAQP